MNGEILGKRIHQIAHIPAELNAVSVGVDLELSDCFCDSWLYFQVESRTFFPTLNTILAESDHFVRPINRVVRVDQLERVLFFVVVEYATVECVFEVSR